MKRLIVTAVAGIALAVCGTAGAADRANQKGADNGQPTDTSRTESQARSDKRAVRPHPGGMIQTSWLIGEKVHDLDGSDLGKIKEVWIDPNDGHVKEVIVSMGATLGVGGKDKVLRWEDLKLAWKDQKLFVTADRNALRDAYQAKMDREDRGAAASPATSGKSR